MSLKKHTGITFTLIGILLPLFGSVCLASVDLHHSLHSCSILRSEKLTTIQKDEIPASKSIIRQEVDFIHRLKNDRFLVRKSPNVSPPLLKYIALPESSFLKFNLVPKPAYYNYLFMLKPF